MTALTRTTEVRLLFAGVVFGIVPWVLIFGYWAILIQVGGCLLALVANLSQHVRLPKA